MKHQAELERWKRIFITAGDETFFRIMRTYLGDIKTPFNKHALIDRLNKLLRKRETIDRIVSLIDPRDARVLSAIDILDVPTLGRLYSLFEGETPYLQLHYHLLNLEERLLVFRDDCDDQTIVRLNPILAEDLRAEILSSSLVFPTAADTSPRVLLSYPTNARIIALASYLATSPIVLKSDGAFRKKATDDTAKLFAEDSPKKGSACTLSLISSLIALGIATVNDGRTELQYEAWSDLCALDSDSTLAYICAGAAASTDISLSISDLADSICSLLNDVDIDRGMGPEHFDRFIRAHSSLPLSDNQSDAVSSALLDLGVFARSEKGRIVCAVVPEEPPTSQGIIVQPTFEVSVPISISLNEASFLPCLCEPVTYDTVSRFEITRHACSRAFELGHTASGVIEMLEGVGTTDVPQNVATTISLWEQEYRSLRVIRGTLFVVAENHRHVFDYDEIIQKSISETIAPGVYLTKSLNADVIRHRLEQTGIEPVPHTTDIDLHKDSLIPGKIDFRSAAAIYGLKMDERRKKAINFDPSEYETSIESMAADLNLSKAQQAELEERIVRRLVLFPEQLINLHASHEVGEAKGFDYLGKVRLIEQALSNGNDLLEIVVAQSDSEVDRILVKPDELEKDDTDLVLIGRTLDGEETVRIRVRSIGHIRKRRGSLMA